jgi:hypothetical protein
VAAVNPFVGTDGVFDLDDDEFDDDEEVSVESEEPKKTSLPSQAQQNLNALAFEKYMKEQSAVFAADIYKATDPNPMLGATRMPFYPSSYQYQPTMQLTGNGFAQMPQGALSPNLQPLMAQYAQNLVAPKLQVPVNPVVQSPFLPNMQPPTVPYGQSLCAPQIQIRMNPSAQTQFLSNMQPIMTQYPQNFGAPKMQVPMNPIVVQSPGAGSYFMGEMKTQMEPVPMYDQSRVGCLGMANLRCNLGALAQNKLWEAKTADLSYDAYRRGLIDSTR